MQDILTLVSRLQRPTLLVRTARHGLADYNRVQHLRRLLKTETPPSPGKAIMRLMELEGAANDARRAQRAEYSVARHVELLVALMSEASILKASNAARTRMDAAAFAKPTNAT